MMPGVNPYYLGFFIVYLVALLGVGVWAHGRTRNVMDFWVFGQRMGPQLATWSLVANFVSAVSVIGFTGAVYSGGYSLMTHTILGLMLGLSGLYFVAEKIKTLNVLTFPDLIARVSGYEVARPIAGTVMLINGLLYLVMQLLAAGLLIHTITGVPYEYMVWVIGVVFIVYTVLGGMVSVAWTDLVQGVLKVTAVTIVLVYMIADQGGLTQINTRLAALNAAWVSPTGGGQYSKTFIAGSFLAFFGTLLTEQDMLIRIASTRNVRIAKLHIAAGGVILSIFYCFLIFLGGAASVALRSHHLPVDTPDAAFPVLITRYVPTGIGVLIILVVMSAILATTDTRLHAVGMTAARDIYSYFRPEASERQMMRVSRSVTVLLGLVATAAAYHPPGTIITIYAMRAVVLTTTFLVPVYLAAYWKGMEGRAVLAGMVAGGVVGVGCELLSPTHMIRGVHASFLGVGAAVAACLIGHAYYRWAA